MGYIEASAKTGENVDQIFESMAANITERIEHKEIDYSNDVASGVLSFSRIGVWNQDRHVLQAE
jgi:hypothetical protein